MKVIKIVIFITLFIFVMFLLLHQSDQILTLNMRIIDCSNGENYLKNKEKFASYIKQVSRKLIKEFNIKLEIKEIVNYQILDDLDVSDFGQEITKDILTTLPDKKFVNIIFFYSSSVLGQTMQNERTIKIFHNKNIDINSVCNTIFHEICHLFSVPDLKITNRKENWKNKECREILNITKDYYYKNQIIDFDPTNLPSEIFLLIIEKMNKMGDLLENPQNKYMNIGIHYYKKSEFDKAISNLLTAKQICVEKKSNNNINVKNGLLERFLLQNDYQNILKTLTASYISIGQYQNVFENALQIEDDCVRNKLIGISYYFTNKLEKSISILEKCLKCPKSDDFKILLADAYLKNTSVADWNSESIKKSIKLLEDVLKIDPQNPNANKILGVIYLKQNKKTLGQQFLNYAAEYGANMYDPIIRKDGVFRLGRKSTVDNESTPDKQIIKMNNGGEGQGQEDFLESD